MKSTDVFCCTILTITVTAVCASPSPSHALFDGTPNRNMRRRETILFVNNFEMPSAQKTIYRRLSKHRFVQPKYPFRGKFYLTKPTLKPVKGTKGRITSKYNTLHKKRAPFQRYAATVPTRVHMPNQPFRPPKKVYAHSKIKPMSFGEPPRKYNKEPQGLGLTDFQLGDFEALSEPLVDSYGAPIKQSLHDLHDLTAHGTDDRIKFHDTQIKTNKGKWTNHKDVDHEVVNIKPMHMDEVFVTPVPVQVPVQKEEPIMDINHDMNVYKDMKKKSKKKSHYMNPIKVQHTKQLKRHGDFVVGGQYAEPPLRYRRDPTGDADLNDDMETADPQSSYVNYKNSNMAFSPQNLNDAFSIV